MKTFKSTDNQRNKMLFLKISMPAAVSWMAVDKWVSLTLSQNNFVLCSKKMLKYLDVLHLEYYRWDLKKNSKFGKALCIKLFIIAKLRVIILTTIVK